MVSGKRDGSVRAATVERSWFERPGAWFWLLFALGVGLRAWFVFGTEGTADVVIWEGHARSVSRTGLIEYYRATQPHLLPPDQPHLTMNHPPVIAWLMTRLFELAPSLGLPFKVLMRLPFALLDLASAFLLVRILAASRFRWVAGGLYCVTPVAAILSAYHGNTDAAIAFFLLLCVLLAGAGRALLTGAVIGLALWIKLPVILAAPALGFSFPKWRERFLCAGAASIVALVGFAPALMRDAPVVLGNVFGYRGLVLFTPQGNYIWGLRNFFPSSFGLDERSYPAWAQFLLFHGSTIAMVAIVVFAFLRRRERSAVAIGASCAGCYALFYALINTWTFQYLAWSIPLWFLAGRTFAILAATLTSAYLWGVYAQSCQDFALRGVWDFGRHGDWGEGLKLLRDLSVLVFAAFALFWFGLAVARELGAKTERAAR